MRYKLKTIFLFFIGFSFSGCLGTRYLQDDEQLLYRQQIVTKNKSISSELPNYLSQKPNRRIPLINFSPYVFMYQWGVRKYDQTKLITKRDSLSTIYDNELLAARGNDRETVKIRKEKNRKLTKLDKKIDEGNLRMRWGEPLSKLDSNLVMRSANNMEQALKNRGYFSAEVDHEIKLKSKRATVKYFVNEKKPHKVDTLMVTTSDTLIYSLIKSNGSKSLIKKGQNYDQSKLSAERDRIDELLKNNGYYDFSKQYIIYNVDTTLGNKKVAVEMEITNPAKRGFHKLFRIDSVIFITDANIAAGSTIKRSSEVVDDITFLYFKNEYSKRVLNRRVFIRKDSLYSREITFNTQRQIANLDMFKFVNINFDTTGGRFIANIYTSPLQKFQTSNEVGMNVSQGLPGPFYNLTFKNRNLMKGMEILELSFRAGIEGVAPATSQANVYQSQEIGGNLSFTVPEFAIPLSNQLKLRLGEVNPKTRLQVGYSYTNRPEYKRGNAKSSVTYSWQNKLGHIYNFSPLDISYIDSRITLPAFDSLLLDLQANGNNLIRSFDPSFVSSIVGYGVYNFGKYGSKKDRSSYLKVYLESGGTFTDYSDLQYFQDRDIIHYRFLKFYSDFRRHYPVNQYNSIAYRINAGFARPYGDLLVLPYEKYFFAGGSNSIRAWAPRRLGPGSSKPRLTQSNGEFDYRFEQPGEIILETTFEFRRHLFGFIDGALFADAGNVWLFSENDNNKGAKFELNSFYREIAVGSGFGLRFDFNFLILRLDLGFKMFDPAQDQGQRFVGDKITWRASSNFGPRYNLGIGFPF